MTRARHRYAWLVGWSLIAVPVAPAFANQAKPSDGAATFEALRAADLQLATIGFRLSTANATLCDRLEPGTGLQLHTLSQYAASSRAQVRTHFGFAGAAAVEGVVPDSPAARAGAKADDTLLAINGVKIGQSAPDEASTSQLAAIHAQLATLNPTAPLTLTLSRAGRMIELRVQPVAACFTRYELRIDNGFDARANGELVQVTSKYFEAIDGDLMPAVVAHELSHNILRHRERLKAVGAEFGMASGFGRNVSYFRQTEIEADILAVDVLARAGYDPRIAARFWREAGPRLMAGMIRSRSHPPLRDRIAIAQAEQNRITGHRGMAAPPDFYLRRGEPLDGNWQSYLPPGSR